MSYGLNVEMHKQVIHHFKSFKLIWLCYEQIFYLLVSYIFVYVCTYLCMSSCEVFILVLEINVSRFTKEDLGLHTEHLLE